MIDRNKVEQAVRLLLEGMGENPSREGLVDTPERVARMYEELTAAWMNTQGCIWKRHSGRKIMT